MAREKLTPEDRQTMRNFIRLLATEHDGGWDHLMYAAGVPSTTAQGWRVGTTPSTPESPTLLRLLLAADALRPEVAQLLEEAQQAAQEAARRAGELGGMTPSDPKRPSSGR